MAPSKKSSKTESSEPIAEPVAAPVVEDKKAKKAPSKKSDAAPEKKAVEKKSDAAASKKSDAAPEKKSASKKSDAAPKQKKTAEVAAAPVEAEGEKTPAGRRQVSKDSVDADFTELTNKIQAEIERLQSSGDKVKGIKFLRTLNKICRTLHNDANRMMGKKKNSGRKAGSTSGFNIPVKISKDMAKFIGGDANAQYNRVDITKKICAYIKENNLQNPADRRQINADEKLRTLLKLEANPAEPLTYFRLQQYLTPHLFSEPSKKKEAAAKQ
jgi:upstream activation factor subunit UAF30